jgi:polysaccharide biosynthesis protein PslH
MHTVIVDGDVSYPPTSGKRLRTLNLMCRMARRHRLTYIARSDGGPSARAASEYLIDHGIEPILVTAPLAEKKGPLFFGRLAANLCSDLPYSIASHRSVAMRRAVEEYAARHEVDLWQFEWLPYKENLRQRGARKLVVAHNVEALLWKRYYENASGAAQRFFLRRQWQRMLRYERRHYPLVDWVVAVSDQDGEILHRDFGAAQVGVVENGIDRHFYEALDGTHRPDQILFLGALDWRPNLDGLDVLVSDIFPRVRAEVPSATLCIVGRNPPDCLVKKVQACAGVTLHADVPDVRPFLGEAGMMVVPLRIGGGSRLKILESLAAGLPVVSTSVGAEGLCLTGGQHFVQADTPAELAEALVSAIRYPDPLRAMAKRGRAVVLDRYDWDCLANKLDKIWQNCARPEPVAAEPNSTEPAYCAAQL